MTGPTQYEETIDRLIERSRQQLKRIPYDESRVPAEDRMSDEKKGIAAPPLEHPIPEGAVTIPLPAIDEIDVGTAPLREVLRQRRSRRTFSDAAFTQEELASLCWSVAGVHRVGPEKRWAKRTSPSSGARHPFETYLVIERVHGIEPGLYRYSGLRHALVRVRAEAAICTKLSEGSLQAFVKDSAVLFVWTTVPYRSEWRYLFAGAKLTAIDIGHYGQNLYLAAASIGAGACTITSYDQSALDCCLGVDGTDEFTLYLAAVGKRSAE